MRANWLRRAARCWSHEKHGTQRGFDGRPSMRWAHRFLACGLEGNYVVPAGTLMRPRKVRDAAKETWEALKGAALSPTHRRSLTQLCACASALRVAATSPLERESRLPSAAQPLRSAASEASPLQRVVRRPLLRPFARRGEPLRLCIGLSSLL